MPEKRKVRFKKSVRSPGSKIRAFKIGSGLPQPSQVRSELGEMREVLLGHQEPPLDVGILTLMEVAEGYFARACDMEQLILEAEADGRLPRGKSLYHTLRTQEIRSFKEMAKSAADLGSRRLTAEGLRREQEMRGRESI